jgi:hypothetical protein
VGSQEKKRLALALALLDSFFYLPTLVLLWEILGWAEFPKETDYGCRRYARRMYLRVCGDLPKVGETCGVVGGINCEK